MNQVIKSILLLLIVTTTESHAAVSFTGRYSGSNTLKTFDGSSNIAAGTRFIVIVDSGTAGFASETAGTSGSLAVNSLFGGDTIIQSSVTADVFARAFTAISNQPLDSPPFAGKQFALVWFSSLTGTTATDGDRYGFYREADWILPSSVGTYNLTFSSSGGDFTQGTTNRSAILTVGAAPIPEPSRMMLLGLGLVGVFFRRRR